MSGAAPVPRLTHLDEAGQARMVDVGAKPVQSRTAGAEGLILCAPETIAAHPDYVVVGIWTWNAQNGDLSFDWVAPEDEFPNGDVYGIIPWAEAHGYHETHRFCGHSFMRNGYAEDLCDVILQPAK